MQVLYLDNRIVTDMTIYVDDTTHNAPAYTYAKQYDANSRFLRIKLMSSSGQIQVAGLAQLNCTKPGGQQVYVAGTNNNDGSVTFGLSSNLLTDVGKVTCDVTVFDAANSSQILLTSSTFYIIVDKSNYDQDAIAGFNEFSTVSNVLAQVTEKKEAAEEAAEDAQDVLEAIENNLIQKGDGLVIESEVESGVIKHYLSLKSGSTKIADSAVQIVGLEDIEEIYTTLSGCATTAALNEETAAIDSQLKKLEEYPVVENLFNDTDTDILENGYINKNGGVTGNTAFFETGYIKCKAGEGFHCAHWAIGSSHSLVITYYNSSKGRVSAVSTAYTSPFYVPNNSRIAYFRMAMNASKRNDLVLYKYNGGIIGDHVPPKNFDFVLYNGTKSLYNELETLGSGIQTLNSGLDTLDAKIDDHWRGKSWYAYGTSLTNSETGRYTSYLAALSGMVLTNKGVSGGALLANRKVYNSVMNSTDGKTNADLITLETGANDRHVNWGTIYDDTDQTYCGCLNQCIRYLQANTNAQIVVMTSTPNVQSSPSYVYSTANLNFHQMNQMVKEICEINGVYYIPMGDGIGYGYGRVYGNGTEIGNAYRRDWIHHTNLGGYNLAQGVWSYLKDIPLWYSEIPG